MGNILKAHDGVAWNGFICFSTGEKLGADVYTTDETDDYVFIVYLLFIYCIS